MFFLSGEWFKSESINLNLKSAKYQAVNISSIPISLNVTQNTNYFRFLCKGFLNKVLPFTLVFVNCKHGKR